MSPEHSILIALLAPFLAAVAGFASGSSRQRAGVIVIAGVAISLAASLHLIALTGSGDVVALHSGGWPAPFGIVLVADAFSSLMLAVCQLVVLAGLVFAGSRPAPALRRRHFFPLLGMLSFGTAGAFLTGDLFNLYVWFEVLLLSSFALMASLGRRADSGTWRYVVINLVSSLLFLGAAGLIYGKAGTLNFADLRLRLAEVESAFLLDSSAALLLGAFGIKAALVPLAFWLPASYPKLPPALAAIFAGLLTKVGLYALYRVFGMVLAVGGDFPHRRLLLALALLTMIGGVLAAVAQSGMRRILSFHIISQVGYMALALALFSPLAVTAGIFYLAHHIVVKANLFLVTGLVEHQVGSSELDQTRGLLHRAPLLALLFAVPALSLAGLPPLSGFFAKFGLLRAALELGHTLSAIAIAGVGLLTIFSMLKIWRHAFWGGEPDRADAPARVRPYLASASLAAVTIAIGLGCGPVFSLARTAANALLEPEAYLSAVLGPRP